MAVVLTILLDSEAAAVKLLERLHAAPIALVNGRCAIIDTAHEWWADRNVGTIVPFGEFLERFAVNQKGKSDE